MQRLCCPLAVLASIAVLAIGACSSTPPPAASTPEKSSVNPGINDAYAGGNVTQWVERFEREGREIYDEREAIVAACRIRPGMDFADIGAGTGLFEPLFAEAVGSRGTVYAVDIDPEFIEHVRTRMAAEGHDNVKVVLCTDRSVELPARSIDLAFICDAYHHFEYPRGTMTSLHRALRPGGRLVVIDFERIEGKSSDFIMNHVRAGKDVSVAEIESFGFELVEDVDMLESNYVLRFVKR